MLKPRTSIPTSDSSPNIQRHQRESRRPKIREFRELRLIYKVCSYPNQYLFIVCAYSDLFVVLCRLCRQCWLSPESAVTLLVSMDLAVCEHEHSIIWWIYSTRGVHEYYCRKSEKDAEDLSSEYAVSFREPARLSLRVGCLERIQVTPAMPHRWSGRKCLQQVQQPYYSG